MKHMENLNWTAKKSRNRFTGRTVKMTTADSWVNVVGIDSVTVSMKENIQTVKTQNAEMITTALETMVDVAMESVIVAMKENIPTVKTHNAEMIATAVAKVLYAIVIRGSVIVNLLDFI